MLSTPTGERPQLEPQRDDSPVTVAADSRENANTREEEAGIDMHSLEHEDELVERTYDPADEAQARDAAQVEDAVDSADANPELPRTFEPNEDEVVARQALPNPDAEGEPSAELAPLATPLAGLTSESTAASLAKPSSGTELVTHTTDVSAAVPSKVAETSVEVTSDAVSAQPQLSELEAEGQELARALQQVANELELPTSRTAAPVAPVAQEINPVHELLLARMLGQLDPSLQRAEERMTLPERLPLMAVGGSKSAETGLSSPSAQMIEQPRMREQQARSGRALSTAQRARTMEKVEEVLKEVARSKDGKTISFRLDPPSLGSMRAEVSMRDGVLHARLWAESSQVTALLREKSHELHSALRKLGLPVDQVAVSVSSPESEFSHSAGFSSGEGSSHGGSQGRRSEKNSLVDTSGFGILGETAPATVTDDHWVA